MILRVLVSSTSRALAADLVAGLEELRLSVLAEALEQTDDLLRRLLREPWDLVLLAPRGESERAGVEATVRTLRDLPEPVDVLVLGTSEARERALWTAAGALAVLDPRLEPELLATMLERILEQRRARAELERSLPGEEHRLDDEASASPAMRVCLRTARRVAPHHTTVLVQGETGVGKEFLARALHARSPRRERPFVPVQCSALPESLLETELFGHAPGAFTGAVRGRRGLFEVADGGTLFLDEIGELPLHLQAKLLRVLQDREIVPVGSTTPVRLDLRLIAATHRDLEQEVAAGRFRADLYYRLAVVVLTVPPLRERREDVPELARARLAACCRELGRSELTFTPEALEGLVRYRWPGNVRELSNVVERAALLCPGERVELADLPLEVQVPPVESSRGGDYRTARDAALEEFDRRYFERLLRECAGRVGEAARESGLTPRGLYDKLQRLGLRKEDYRDRRPGRT